MNRIKPSVKIQLFLLTTALLLVACGQRGPLFLPEPEQKPAEPTETEANETGEDGEKTSGPLTG